MKRNIFSKAFYASLLIAASVTGVLAQGVITTIAGTGIGGFSGDGGPAITAQFSSPAGVSVDISGNIFIADKYNHRIRKIATDGTISTVAGSGSSGYYGMGGPAVAAHMIYPDAVFADIAGNLSITDFFADCSYTVNNTTGIINNSCGHDSQGCGGDGGDAPDATMELPHGICKDNAGNTYIADYGNNRIRRIDGATNIVTTIAGGGAYGFSISGTLASACHFSGINGVCVDHAGNIYISDLGNHMVRKIDPSGRVRTVAGTGVSGYSGDGGPALAATLRTPSGLFVNSSGYLFICDESSNVVRVVNLNSGIIKTFAGSGVAGFSGDGGPAIAARLNAPSAIWQFSDVFYIADMGNQRIREVIDAGYKSSSFNSVGTVATNSFNVFPNPSNGSFTIQTTVAPENGTIEVYNIIGSKVYSQRINSTQATLNLDVPSGVYSLLLRSKTGVTTQKIVVQK